MAKNKVVKKEVQNIEIKSELPNKRNPFKTFIFGCLVVWGFLVLMCMLMLLVGELSKLRRQVSDLRFQVMQFDDMLDEHSGQSQEESIDPTVVPTITPVPTLAHIFGIAFTSPVPYDCGVVTQGYAPYHLGVDIREEEGCWIKSVAEGIVKSLGYGEDGEGYYVELDHGNGVITEYHHGNGNFKVEPGDRVAIGQDIMFMGCTGKCTGTHLHFELLVNGKNINPELYVPNLR